MIVTLPNLSDDFIANFNTGEISVDFNRAAQVLPTHRVFTRNGEIRETKTFYERVTAVDGVWEVDYSFMNFKTIIGVTALGVNAGTALADKRLISLDVGNPTLTKCKGNMVSSSAAGLLVAVTLTSASGSFWLSVTGY